MRCAVKIMVVMVMIMINSNTNDNNDNGSTVILITEWATQTDYFLHFIMVTLCFLVCNWKGVAHRSSNMT